MSNTDFTKPTDEADKQEALDLWQQQIAYTETIYNGTVIRWRYWVEQMPQLSAAEAARLMSALDPDIFANLDNRPNKNDPSKRCERAAVIQRLAERKGMQVATPAEWLPWAIQEGFVVHDGFRLAVESAPAQNTATLAPAVAASDGPAPLTTGDIAHCFAGLRWDESRWKKPLGDLPKWLAGCVVIPGQKGVSERRWNPVYIGAALVQQGHVKARNVRAKFQTVDLLRPWLDVWKTYEADNFDSA